MLIFTYITFPGLDEAGIVVDVGAGAVSAPVVGVEFEKGKFQRGKKRLRIGSRGKRTRSQ